jgi:geranylgeranyl pyrophosphate synthase
MTLYTAELKSFESFCRTEFQTLFHDPAHAVSGVLSSIDSIQKMGITAESNASAENAQFKSMEYSFFSGGKRFRPLLSFACADYLGLPISRLFPWAMAIEMIHTYSLIHDDLPSMDNDDFRRGKPTNHKVFGEAVALLSGDALLTHAFALLAKHYADDGALLGLLISNLAKISGLNGMILGQYYDITLDQSVSEPVGSADVCHTVSNLNKIHLLKTGALISGAIMGAALIKKCTDHDLELMNEIGFFLGYAFQVKDDILDSEQDKGSKKNLNFFYKDIPALTLFLGRIHKEIEMKIGVVDKSINISSDKSQCLTQFLGWNLKRDT